jgi:hypothetical protein
MPVAIPVVAAGLLLILWLYATSPMLRQIVASLGGAIPGLSQFLGDRLREFEAASAAQLRTWGTQAIQPIIDTFNHLTTVNRSYAGAVDVAMGANVGAIWRLRYQALPALEARAQSYAFGQVQALRTELLAQLQSALGYVAQLVRNAEQFAVSLYNAAVTYAGALYRSAADLAQYLHALALARAAEVLAMAINYSQLAFIQLEQFVTATSAADRNYTDRSASQTAEYARILTLGAERLAEQLSANDRIYTDVRAANVATAAAAATAVVAQAVTAIEESSCMRQCNPLGALGADLAALDLVALLGLVVAAAGDPKNAARALEETLTPIASAVHQGAHDLLGVP